MKLYVSDLPAKQIRQAIRGEIQLKDFFARIGMIGVKEFIFGYILGNMIIFCVHPDSHEKSPLDNRLSFSVTCFLIPRKNKTYLLTYCHPQYYRLLVAPIVIFGLLTTIMSLITTSNLDLAFYIWLNFDCRPLLAIVGIFLFGMALAVDLVTGLFHRHYGKVEEIIKRCAQIDM